VVGEVQVRAAPGQRDELLAWASAFVTRTWAIESAGGLGYLLAQQLVAGGEEVLDIPPMLAARVRVLGSGRSAKNDANDARSWPSRRYGLRRCVRCVARTISPCCAC
jgi:transposase